MLSTVLSTDDDSFESLVDRFATQFSKSVVSNALAIVSTARAAQQEETMSVSEAIDADDLEQQGWVNIGFPEVSELERGVLVRVRFKCTLHKRNCWTICREFRSHERGMRRWSSFGSSNHMDAEDIARSQSQIKYCTSFHPSKENECCLAVFFNREGDIMYGKPMLREVFDQIGVDAHFHLFKSSGTLSSEAKKNSVNFSYSLFVMSHHAGRLDGEITTSVFNDCVRLKKPIIVVLFASGAAASPAIGAASFFPGRQIVQFAQVKGGLVPSFSEHNRSLRAMRRLFDKFECENIHGLDTANPIWQALLEFFLCRSTDHAVAEYKPATEMLKITAPTAQDLSATTYVSQDEREDASLLPPNEAEAEKNEAHEGDRSDLKAAP